MSEARKAKGRTAKRRRQARAENKAARAQAERPGEAVRLILALAQDAALIESIEGGCEGDEDASARYVELARTLKTLRGTIALANRQSVPLANMLGTLALPDNGIATFATSHSYMIPEGGRFRISVPKGLDTDEDKDSDMYFVGADLIAMADGKEFVLAGVWTCKPREGDSIGPGESLITVNNDANMFLLGLCEQAAALLDPDSDTGRSLLARAAAKLPEPPERRDLVTLQVPGTGRGGMSDYLRLARSPAIIDLSLASPIEQAHVDSIEVDGEPFATQIPPNLPMRRYVGRAEQRGGQLNLPGMGPRTVRGRRVRDVVLATVADLPLTGDERNPLRGDVVRIARLGFALSGPAIIEPADGARFLTGENSLASRKRWNDALRVARWITVTLDPKEGQWIDLVNVSIGPEGAAHLEAPVWWQGRDAWRLTGGLWRQPLIGGKAVRGTTAGFWGGLARTIDGLESRIAWSGARVRGKQGRIAEALRPERPGGPGPEVFVPWTDVLRGAGEHVPEGADPRGKVGRRWRRRRDALVDGAGYMCEGGNPAPAGDTVEVVRIKTGGGGRGEAGLSVRATARFCAAAELSRAASEWSRIPLLRLLRPKPAP